jgi:hypothetical protein
MRKPGKKEARKVFIRKAGKQEGNFLPSITWASIS